MSVAQALAIAAAAWVTAVAANPALTTAFHRAQSRAEALAARFEMTAARRLARVEGGFHATPDGLRIERKAALR